MIFLNKKNFIAKKKLVKIKMNYFIHTVHNLLVWTEKIKVYLLKNFREGNGFFL